VPISKPYLDRLANAGEDPGNVMQEFFNDLGDSDYIDNLGCLCQSGGYPDEDSDPEIVVKSVSRSANSLRATCEVFFDEKYFGSGCPDMPTLVPIHGTVVYEVDLSTGHLATVDDDLISAGYGDEG
jgi:hypothetical protein